MGTIAFLPIKGVSERVPDKAFKPFADVEGGLTALKVRQLQRVEGLERILISSPPDENMQRVREAAQIGERQDGVPVVMVQEPLHRGGTDGMIRWAAQITEADPADTEVLFTHVTSPFFDEGWYAKALSAYRSRLKMGFDSLATCTSVQDFLWGLNGPINWNRRRQKWPRTQDLPPFRLVHSAAFIAPLSIYRQNHDRIGKKPFLFVTTKRAAIDIDWPDDWEMAEALWRNRQN